MKTIVIEDGAIHYWFELSYSSYMVLQRSILQSMPLEWQERFVAMLDEIEETLEIPKQPNFIVLAKDDKGRFTVDKLRDYDRGRRRLPHLKQKQR